MKVVQAFQDISPTAESVPFYNWIRDISLATSWFEPIAFSDLNSRLPTNEPHIHVLRGSDEEPYV